MTSISREPRYQWDAIKKWPDSGEMVNFTAHIINKGTINSGPFVFQWTMDNQVVSTGSASSIPPQAEATQGFNWMWQSGRHYLGFQVDPQNLIPETAESNNIIIDPTDALTLGFWVEESVYNEFNHKQNGAGTYSWEDWAQRIIQKMNWMFEQSVYPSAPQGVFTRVRLDNITIVPDETLFNQGPWHAPYDTIYDGRWGFSLFSDYHAISLNRDWPQGQRTHNGWNYIYEIPSETRIRVLDNDDQPIQNVEVSVYQALPGDGSSGPYSQNIDNIPDIVGVTDSQGVVSLGGKPFGNFETYGMAAGIALVKLKLNTSIYLE